MPCFYSATFTTSSDRITIEGDEFHHLAHVFRKQQGANLLITNGKGLLALAELIQINKKIAHLSILSIEEKRKSAPYLALAFSLLKQKNDELIVEKATELGVTDFFPYISSRTIRKQSHATQERFKKIIIAASKQCDNVVFPRLHTISNLSDLISNLQQFNYTSFVAYENEKQNYLVDAAVPSDKERLALIIGPEGGFSQQEIEQFIKHEISTVSIGNHILRAETAAIAGLSQLQAYFLKKNHNYY